MKSSEFKKLIREEVRKVLKEVSTPQEKEGLYNAIGDPKAAQLQKAMDKKYGELYTAIKNTPELNSIVQSYMNRADSIETAEDLYNYNDGLREVFDMAIEDIVKVNSLLHKLR